MCVLVHTQSLIISRASLCLLREGEALLEWGGLLCPGLLKCQLSHGRACDSLPDSLPPLQQTPSLQGGQDGAFSFIPHSVTKPVLDHVYTQKNSFRHKTLGPALHQSLERQKNKIQPLPSSFSQSDSQGNKQVITNQCDISRRYTQGTYIYLEDWYIWL